MQLELVLKHRMGLSVQYQFHKKEPRWIDLEKPCHDLEQWQSWFFYHNWRIKPDDQTD